MKKILSIIGARPQFIKHAPMQLQLQRYFRALTLNTGQHYDQNMSDVFFNELNIPKPDFLFDIGGSKPQGEQTGIMMTMIEKTCINEKPDAILVYGDTNSTLAGALVAAKMHIPLIHIEAGLRSFNRSMPEEINRIVADEFAQLLFCPTQQAIDNLKKEGIHHQGIFLCGDVMCDMLELIKPRLQQLFNEPYYFVTIHRPYNTDDEKRLKRILTTLNSLDKRIVFPIHPRTATRMRQFDMHMQDFKNIYFIEPVGYLHSVSYQQFASAVITDSGGMQKEAYMLRKPCITLRSETEWTETLTNEWNVLVYEDIETIPKKLNRTIGSYKERLYGDGHAAEEIVKKILLYMKSQTISYL